MRESPMWAIATLSPTRRMPLTVVPMPVSSLCSNTVSASSEFAAMSADCSANSASSGEAYSMSASATRFAAIADATSPPACPPIPSATTKRCAPA